MPPGDEDVTTSLESSTSETTPPDTQVPAPEEASPPAEAGADADQQSTEVNSAPPTEKPDPVQEAMARLAKPEPQAKATKPAVQSKEPTDQKPSEKPAPERAAEAKPKVGPTLDDPYAGWLPTEQAKALLKPQTRQRIEELHHQWKAAETHPARVLGNEFQTLLDTHKLNDDLGFVQPDHLAGLIKAQAAVNRGLLAVEQGRRPAGSDVQVFQALAQQIDALREQFGIKPKAPQVPEIQPLQGELPAEYQDLISIFNLPEDRVRMLAAIERSSAAKRQAAPAAPAQTATPTATADNRPEGVDMEALHARRMEGVFARDGIPAERFAVHQQVLVPIMQQIVAREFPGLTKSQIISVYNAMTAKERADIAIQAHTEYRSGKASNPPPPKTQQLPPATRPPLQGTPGRKPPEIKGDALDSAIAYLARPPAGE